jgi:hypothetical protein
MRNWPWGCLEQNPAHEGRRSIAEERPAGPDVRCVQLLADYDLAHPDNPLCNPPRDGWIYCRVKPTEGSPLTAEQAAEQDRVLAELEDRWAPRGRR